jgi:DNA-binding GntR family transcriptional regulator
MEIKSVTKSVVEFLRLKIITGEFESGQKLNENYIASQLDISRHPIREAFRILENEQLVSSIPRKGAYVSDLSIDDLEQVYWVREMIEASAIEYLKAKNIRDLPKAMSSLKYASSLHRPKSDNLEQSLAYLETMADFHLKLVEHAENKFLTGFYKSIYSHLFRYQFICSYMPGSRQRSLQEHRKILSLIEGGAYEKAKKLLKEHLFYTFEFLKTKFSEGDIRKTGDI